MDPGGLAATRRARARALARAALGLCGALLWTCFLTLLYFPSHRWSLALIREDRRVALRASVGHTNGASLRAIASSVSCAQAGKQAIPQISNPTLNP